MNYKKVYESIIQKRIQTPIDSGEYVERHHIVPRSLGGDDNETNLIRLTAREHFICHALLAEMYEEGTNEWYKLNHAFMMMKAESSEHGGNRYINSKLYALKKEDFSKVMSYSQSGNKNSQFGKKKSEEQKEHLRRKLAKNGLTHKEKLNLKYNGQTKAKKYTKYKLSFSRLRSLESLFNVSLINDVDNSVESVRDILIKLYIEDNLTNSKIASLFNTSSETIRLILHEFNIPQRNRGTCKLKMRD